ncbi:MAG: 4a-hydroxytetrahydrobiopterin dehydratase [Deltaproteobacteria bacterium]|nr:4a-hydroxytetrahydrobiopterin dehydratase [Deltaproteobacteria bacterium]
MRLSEENCEPVKTGQHPVPYNEAKEFAREVPEWNLRDTSLEREYRFKDFGESMGFVNKVAEVAESQAHHPDIFISYNKVHLSISTHKIGGLSRNDFILAARIDHLGVPA